MALPSDLHAVLVGILESSNVYFQPPSTLVMQYPCIVYSRSRRVTNHANNVPYRHVKSYVVTVIDADPGSEIPEKIADLPMCSFDRHYTTNNLNHDVYTLFF